MVEILLWGIAAGEGVWVWVVNAAPAAPSGVAGMAIGLAIGLAVGLAVGLCRVNAAPGRASR